MIDHAGSSARGQVRSRYEDFIASHIPSDDAVRARKGSLFAVADGVGGSEAGDVASREAALTLIQCYYESEQRPEKALRKSFQRINHHLFDLSHGGPGGNGFTRTETTLTGFVLVGDQVHVGHVGDSRVYRIRPERDEIVQLTRDHSEVAELARMGVLTADEARRHPRRNIITRSLGSQFAVNADFRTETVSPGDVFILCTDGLWEPVDEKEMIAIVRENEAEEACTQLIQLALHRETTDNLSVQIVKVLELEERATEPSFRATARSFLQRSLGLLRGSGRPPAQALAGDRRARHIPMGG